MGDRIESCSSCRFYKPFKTDEWGDGAGVCRRYPPQLSDTMLKLLIDYTHEDDSVMNRWEAALHLIHDCTNWQFPTITLSHDDWCGEYQRNMQAAQEYDRSCNIKGDEFPAETLPPPAQSGD